MEKKLYRSRSDKKLAGVCGGLGQYFGIDATLVRLAFVIFCLMGGSGVLVYIICALVMKEEPDGYTPYQDVSGDRNNSRNGYNTQNNSWNTQNNGWNTQNNGWNGQDNGWNTQDNGRNDPNGQNNG